VERAVLLSGIGGQGVQLAAQVLAEAALDEGRDVQLFGSYGGMMRGGNTDATVVLSDDRVTAPPTVDDAWAALVLHHEYAAPVLRRVRPGGLVVRNSTVWEGTVPGPGFEVVDVPATELALGVGSVLAAAMVLLGALAADSAVVGLEALHAAARRALPPYRVQHIDANARALDAGAAAVAPGRTEAWALPAGGGR